MPGAFTNEEEDEVIIGEEETVIHEDLERAKRSQIEEESVELAFKHPAVQDKLRKYFKRLENYHGAIRQLKNQCHAYKHRAQVTEEDLEHERLTNTDLVAENQRLEQRIRELEAKEQDNLPAFTVDATAITAGSPRRPSRPPKEETTSYARGRSRQPNFPDDSDPSSSSDDSDILGRFNRQFRANGRRSRRLDSGVTMAGTINYRPRGIDPHEKLTGESADEYDPWEYAVKEKIRVDRPLYPDEKSKIRYALAHIKPPLFKSMHEWVRDEPRATLDEFLEEIRHYIGHHLQERQARKDLRDIRQQQSESVTQYYHRIRSLWQKANISEEDRIDQFMVTISPALSSSLLQKEYHSIRRLLDDARRIEDRKKDVAFNHPRPIKSSRASNQRNAATASAGKLSAEPAAVDTKAAGSTASITITRSSPHPNQRFGPVTVKPDGWVGTWHNAEANPPRLSPEIKASLLRQGRCWSCRGSGHRGSDECCPYYSKKFSEITLAESSDEGSKTGKA